MRLALTAVMFATLCAPTVPALAQEEQQCKSVFDCAVFMAKTARRMEEIMARLPPPGAVVAFNLKQCPPGWQVFEAGSGRVIVGMGAADGLTARSLLDQGGHEGMPISIDNIPAHQHETAITVLSQAPFGISGQHAWSIQGAGQGQVGFMALSSMAGKMPPDPIPTMPPFVSLLYCERLPSLQ